MKRTRAKKRSQAAKSEPRPFDIKRRMREAAETTRAFAESDIGRRMREALQGAEAFFEGNEALREWRDQLRRGELPVKGAAPSSPPPRKAGGRPPRDWEAAKAWLRVHIATHGLAGQEALATTVRDEYFTPREAPHLTTIVRLIVRPVWREAKKGKT
jgi:hypothetical protein